MKSATIFFAAGLLAGAVLVAAVPGFSQEEDPHAKFGRADPTPEEMQAGMAKWQETMTPGIRHERLAWFLGEWETETEITLEGMGGEPSPGRATFRWLLDGRWLLQETHGSMMGQPFSGYELRGYDNFKKQYVGAWVDTMSTALLTMQGNIDQTGKVIEMYGEMDEPMFGQVGKTAKYVTRILSEDRFVFEIHDLDIIGGPTKVISVTYNRVKND